MGASPLRRSRDPFPFSFTARFLMEENMRWLFLVCLFALVACGDDKETGEPEADTDTDTDTDMDTDADADSDTDTDTDADTDFTLTVESSLESLTTRQTVNFTLIATYSSGSETDVTNEATFTSDDPSILFRFFDGFFLYGFLLAWADHDYMDMFDPQQRDTSARDFGWLESIWRRNLVANRAQRIVVKVFSLGLRLPVFLERFPDARVIYMLRDPVSVVPSGLSLVTGVLDARFGFWSLPEERRQRYIQRLYGALLELSRRFHADWVAGRIRKDRILFVQYHRMMKDFDGLMGEILEFVDHEPSAELLAEIQQVAEKQRAYQSKHKYDLARFGLSRQQIMDDYAFLYDTFNLPRPRVEPPEAPEG